MSFQTETRKTFADKVDGAGVQASEIFEEQYRDTDFNGFKHALLFDPPDGQVFANVHTFHEVTEAVREP